MFLHVAILLLVRGIPVLDYHQVLPYWLRCEAMLRMIALDPDPLNQQWKGVVANITIIFLVEVQSDTKDRTIL